MLAFAWSKFFFKDEMEPRRSVDSTELRRLKALSIEPLRPELAETVGTFDSIVDF